MWIQLHPITQWLYYVVALLLGMLLFHPAALLVGVFILSAVHFYVFRQFRLGKMFQKMLLMTLLLSILNPLLSHRGSHLITIFSYPITVEAILYGITWGLSLSMILLVFRLYQDCFPSSLFLAIFHRFSPQWSLLLVLSLRFFSLFQKRLHEIKVGQVYRYQNSRSSWKEKVRHAEQHLLTLVSWSLEDALQTVDSMKARGYGRRSRSNYLCHRFTQRDAILCGVILFLVFTEIYLWFLGYGRLRIYPYLEPVFPTFMGWISVVIESIILAVPILYEGGKRLRWHYWKLRTYILLIQKQKNRL